MSVHEHVKSLPCQVDAGRIRGLLGLLLVTEHPQKTSVHPHQCVSAEHKVRWKIKYARQNIDGDGAPHQCFSGDGAQLGSQVCAVVCSTFHFYLLRTINVRGGLGSRETFTSTRPSDAVTIRVHQLRANIKHKLIAEDGERGREEGGKRRGNKVRIRCIRGKTNITFS